MAKFEIRYDDSTLQSLLKNMTGDELMEARRQGTIGAAKQFAAAVKSGISGSGLKKRSGNLRKYAVRSTLPKKGSDIAIVQITAARFAAPDSGKGVYYAPMLEAGTVKRSTKKGYNRGRVGAYSFFTGAVASTEATV